MPWIASTNARGRLNSLLETQRILHRNVVGKPSSSTHSVSRPGSATSHEPVSPITAVSPIRYYSVPRAAQQRPAWSCVHTPIALLAPSGAELVSPAFQRGVPAVKRVSEPRRDGGRMSCQQFNPRSEGAPPSPRTGAGKRGRQDGTPHPPPLLHQKWCGADSSSQGRSSVKSCRTVPHPPTPRWHLANHLLRCGRSH
jgi:hypothetical protein